VVVDGDKPTDSDVLAYERIRALADVAVQTVGKRIDDALRRLGDPYLVRGQVTEPRIKNVASLKRKATAKQFQWTFEEALTKAQDLVGFRLVCNNLQDVLRASDLLQASLENDGLKVRRSDYVAKPKRDGYRAIHLSFYLPVRIGNDEAALGCEVQIRSLLQNSWATLSRADVYANQASRGPGVARDMASLARLLAKADNVAERIRRRISKPRRGQRPVPGQTLTASALAFIYRRRFGENPPDYVVQGVTREFGAYDLRTDGLETVLHDEKFVNQLCSAYAEEADWQADETQIFRWTVLSLLVGPDAAIRRARSDGRADWREVSRIARREALASIPGVEDLLVALETPQKDEDPEWDLKSWAGALDATSQCAYCGTTIVHPDEFADSAVQYYKLRGRRAEETRERLRDAAQSVATETGSWGSSSICSYCSYVLNKDD
jgi:ppGpp synthetase/RelA/SpoT-type nucleotidyltranferase